MNVNCTEISTINQFRNSVFVFYLSCHRSHSAVVKKKLSVALVKAKIVRLLTDLNIEDGFNSKLHYSNKWQVLLQTDTRASIRGTSMSTPTTVANAAPEERPNKTTAVAIATSK